MAIVLYEEDGWINIPSIASLDCPFNVLVGPRQVGKTFGVLKYLISNEIKFLFTRRTPTELDTCLKGSTSTFAPVCQYLGIDYVIERDSTYIQRVDFYRKNEKEPFTSALCVALTSISKIRGFSGIDITDWVYDEFIPEITVKRMRGEGDAYVNAYITINGNRELKDMPPLRAWLLANSNDLYSPVLAELGLSEKVEQMVKKDQEYTYMPHRGAFVALPRSEKVIAKRRETALYRLTGTSTSAARMALENDFAYNNTNDVCPQDLDYFNCKFTIGTYGVWRNKIDPTQYYVCRKTAGAPAEIKTNSTRGINKQLVELGYTDFIDRIYKGEVLFADYSIKRVVLGLLNKPIL